MRHISVERPPQTHYDRLYDEFVNLGESSAMAQELVAEAYLDGKPRARGKKRITRLERDTAFWTSEFLHAVPADGWKSPPLTLALARYFNQERVSNSGLLERIAAMAPDVVERTVRYSGLVLSQDSPRRLELAQISGLAPGVVELCRVLDIFGQAHRERVEAVTVLKGKLAELSPFDLIVYASLYAFEHLVSGYLEVQRRPEGADAQLQENWEALSELLTWKLTTAPENTLKLTEAAIASSLAQHFSTILFPSRSAQPASHDLRETFERLVDAQIELSRFISQSADAFSYDDGIQFTRHEDRLEISEIDPEKREFWLRDGRKLARLHGYWLLRALDEFVSAGMDSQPIGTIENQDANRLAYIRAMRTHLQLVDVYGLDDEITIDGGESVDLFQALLSLEMMSALFQRDFLEVFSRNRSETGDWIAALRQLILNGLLDGQKNRFPVTWSDRATKIDNLLDATRTAKFPQGNPRSAAALLDFWASDWVVISARMRRGDPGLSPELFERPILKLGQVLVQLPWLVGLQNNSSAAINNLRRLGARRGDAGIETRRIEERLSSLFEERGFNVALNWHPPIEDGLNAGEVDLICAKDGIVLVLELKSTFLRRSQREAWLHATTTLRKAGQQLRKKVAAVRHELSQGNELATMLNIGNTFHGAIHGWIVDTSVESDHQFFNGFLKVSLEEVLIALRDERHLLRDPGSLNACHGWTPEPDETSLYPQGFTVSRFIDVIENGLVWIEG